MKWLFRLGVSSLLMSVVVLLLLNRSIDNESVNLWLNIGQIFMTGGLVLVAVWTLLTIRQD